MNIDKSEITTILYKIFIVLMITFQIYALVYQLINIYTLIANVCLAIYLIFRYFLLYKLSKEAKELNITLTEFLGHRVKKKCNCDDDD